MVDHLETSLTLQKLLLEYPEVKLAIRNFLIESGFVAYMDETDDDVPMSTIYDKFGREYVSIHEKCDLRNFLNLMSVIDKRKSDQDSSEILQSIGYS